MRNFVAVSRFCRNWCPLRFDQLEWRRSRDCELTDAMGKSLRVRRPREEAIEGFWMVRESAVSDGVHGKECECGRCWVGFDEANVQRERMRLDDHSKPLFITFILCAA